MTDRERAFRERADAILRELLAALESEPDRLDAVDMLILALRGIGIRATQHPGEPVTLSPADVAILADGAAGLLRAFAETDVAEAERRDAETARALAGKPPAILH